MSCLVRRHLLGAQRPANGKLPLSRKTPCQQEAADIAAYDEQHHTGNAHQQSHHCAPGSCARYSSIGVTEALQSVLCLNRLAE